MTTFNPLDVVSFALQDSPNHDHAQAIFIDAQCPSRSLNSRQIRRLVRTLIAGFKAEGLVSGDCILLHMGNNVLYSALFLAVIGAGCVYMGSNPDNRQKDLDELLQVAQAKLIITTPGALSTVLPAAARQGIPSTAILVMDDEAIDEAVSWLQDKQDVPFDPSNLGDEHHSFFQRLLGCGESDWAVMMDVATSKATPAAMFSTSGTSGFPKAAIHSHHSIISQHWSIASSSPYAVRRLIVLPMFHLFASLWAHLFPVRYGQPLYVMSQFNLYGFLKAVHQYQISETFLVPTMVHLINQASFPVQEYLQTLRYIGVSGELIDRQAMERFREFLHPDACPGQLWGMTEVGIAFKTHYVHQSPANHPDVRSIGRVTSGYEVKLLDEFTKDPILLDDAPGMLYVRGDGLFVGYKGRDGAKDSDGWFCTGDVLYRRGEHYFMVGRSKELIKVRGFQVSPAEIEAVLKKHPDIHDAAVIGVGLADGSGEAPRAYVVRGGSSNITAEKIYSFIQEQMVSYKSLDGGVVFVDHIPRTVTGKIQRGILSQMNSRREMLGELMLNSKHHILPVHPLYPSSGATVDTPPRDNA